MAGRGVNGFDYFCRNKSGSAAGRKPGKKFDSFSNGAEGQA